MKKEESKSSMGTESSSSSSSVQVHAATHSSAFVTRVGSVNATRTTLMSVDEEKEALRKHSHEDESDAEDEEDNEPLELDASTKRYGYAVAALMVVITFYSIPHGASGKSAHYVWWCGWLTAVATGLGAVPFYWLRDINKYWLGICNGLAGGMMLAATGCLFYEAWHIPQYVDYGVSITYRLFVGVFLGVLFIKFTKVYLEDYEDVKVCGLKGLDARKALLIMAVMTLHSISEGVRACLCVRCMLRWLLMGSIACLWCCRSVSVCLLAAKVASVVATS